MRCVNNAMYHVTLTGGSVNTWACMCQVFMAYLWINGELVLPQYIWRYTVHYQVWPLNVKSMLWNYLTIKPCSQTYFLVLMLLIYGNGGYSKTELSSNGVQEHNSYFTVHSESVQCPDPFTFSHFVTLQSYAKIVKIPPHQSTLITP